MRQGLDIGANLQRVLAEHVNAAESIAVDFRNIMPEPVQLNGQQCHSLGEVVMKFSSDAGALFLLRFNQSAANAVKRVFCELALGDIDAGSYVASE